MLVVARRGIIRLVKLHEGDVVRVLEPGANRDRVGAIYDAIGHDSWKRTSATGEVEYRVYFDLELDAGWFTSDQLRLLVPMPAARYAPEDRVRITDAAPWAQGETATVDEEWAIERHRSGPTRSYWVRLDHVRDDGSGDGPYTGGTFSEHDLEPMTRPH